MSACACLIVALTVAVQEPTIQIVGHGLRMTVPGVHANGHEVYPLILLTALGSEIEYVKRGAKVQLFGDTLLIEPPHVYRVGDRKLVRLDTPAFHSEGMLYLAREFFTEWLPLRHPARVRFAQGVLSLQHREVPGGTAASMPVGSIPVNDRAPVDAPSPPAPEVRLEAATIGAGEDDEDEDRWPGSLMGFIDARISTAYDTNIDHEPETTPSYGATTRLRAGLQTSRSRPLFSANYELAVHRFTNTERWNRVTHDVRAGFNVKLGGPVRVLLGGQIRLGSSTEDRERADQFIVDPQLELRLNRANRVTLYGTQRVRRFTEAVDRNSVNRLAGIEYRLRWGTAWQWKLEGRFELNDANRLRDRYERWMGKTALQIPFTKQNWLVLEGRYRWRKYETRFADEDETALRVDRRWTPAAYLVHRSPGHAWEVRLEYELDDNHSNDLEEFYRAHRVEFTIRRRL